MSVVLPAPDMPTNATSSPLCDLEGDVAERGLRRPRIRERHVLEGDAVAKAGQRDGRRERPRWRCGVSRISKTRSTEPSDCCTVLTMRES